jgi:hypothetical protein
MTMTNSKLVILIIGLGMMFLFLVGCGSTPSSETPVPAETLTPRQDDNATSGAAQRSTRQAQQTIDAQSTLNAHITETAVAAETLRAQEYATATVVARVTGEAVFAAKSAWPVVVSETFQNNDLGWLLGVTTDRSPVVTADIVDGMYQWSVVVPDSGSYINLVPKRATVFSAFHASVSMQFQAGDTRNQTFYGLVFRRVGRDYGFFGISRSGSVRMLEVYDGGIETLVQESSEFILTDVGQVNRLEVVGIGPDFVFIINGHVIGQMNAELDPGTIGLGVEASSSADQAQIWFSDFEVASPEK